MKRMIFTLLSICSAFSIDSCNTKELNLIGDNPVELSTDIEGSYFTGDPLQAKITLEPKHLGYAMDYFISYEQDTGEGVYKIEEEIFTTDNVHTITNDDVVTVAINFESANEGVHRSKWSVRNSFDQVTAIDLEFNIKKKPNTDPEIDTDPEDDEDDLVVIVAADDTATSADGASVLIDVLANDTISSEDILGIKEIGAVKNGIAVLEDNKIRYTPTIDFSGSETISYTVTDGKGNESSAIITIDVVIKTYTLEDREFESWLVENKFDTDGETNGKILKSDADLLEELVIHGYKYSKAGDQGSNFKNLDDLKTFKNLKSITLKNVLKLETLDLTGLRHLKSIFLSSCPDLVKVITDGLVNLKEFEINFSPNFYEFVPTSSPDLERISIKHTNLARLKITENTKLIDLTVNYASLRKLDLSLNSELTTLELKYISGFSILDISNNRQLENFHLSGLHVNTIDFSKNQALKNLNISSTALRKIDLSNQKQIEILVIQSNEDLTQVDFANDNYALPERFNITYCPIFKCLQVDNYLEFEKMISENLQYRFDDSATTISENCNY